MNIRLQSMAVAAAMAGSIAVSQAAVTANFTDGAGTSSADQFAGKPGNGWASAWQAANGTRTGYGTVVTIDGTVMSSSPLSAGGNYLEATYTSTANAIAGNGAFWGRTLDSAANGGIDTKSAYSIRFDFRAASLAAPSQYFQMLGNSGIGGSGSTNTWSIRAASNSAGTAAIWTVGTYNTSNQFVFVQLSGITFAANKVYSVTINVDPAASTWSTTITDGSSTGTASGLAFRNRTATDGGSSMMFGGFVPDGVSSYTFDLDNLAVTAVPEAASSMTLLGGAAILLMRRVVTAGRR